MAVNVSFDQDGFFNFELLISGWVQLFGLNAGMGKKLADLSNPLSAGMDFAIAIGGGISPLAKLLPVLAQAIGTFETEFLLADLLSNVKEALARQDSAKASSDEVAAELLEDTLHWACPLNQRECHH